MFFCYFVWIFILTTDHPVSPPGVWAFVWLVRWEKEKRWSRQNQRVTNLKSRSPVIWPLLCFLFPSYAKHQCKTMAPLCQGLWSKSRRMPPEPRKSPWRPLSENHVTGGHCEETILNTMAQDGMPFISGFQPKKTLTDWLCRLLLAVSSMLDSH